MTERGKSDLTRSPDRFQVGPSALHWDGETLVVDVNEVCAPFPKPLHGTIRLRPKAPQPLAFALDEASQHQWWPYAPFADVEVDFDRPNLHWRGHGYSDTNRGERAMEADFCGWDWCRMTLSDGAALLYDPHERTGDAHSIAVKIASDGTLAPFEAPPPASLKRGLWGVPRNTRCDAGAKPALLHAFEDAPFYTRSAIETTLAGTRCEGVHESLDLDRFSSGWVKTLLPFRMPRRAR